MSSLTIKKVEDKKGLEKFIQFHYDLYRGSKYEVPNLYSDEVNTLTPSKNAASEFCESQLFIAERDGKVVGRIAAIINKRANERWKSKTVRFGWIDFIDDIEVSKALLETAEKWGKERGMDNIVGPLGFTDMDPEGMLTFGFNELGTLATIYNYDYYPKHIEQLGGFEKDNDYIEMNITIPHELTPRYKRIAEIVMQREHLHIRKLTKKDVFEGGYGHKLFDVINAAFKDIYGYSQMTEHQIDQYIKMYFPMADLNLISCIEDENQRVVACGITLPSLSKAMQKCKNGRLFPFGWWHVLRALKFHKSEGVDLMLIGVLPEYQKKGVNSLLFYDLHAMYIKYGFKWAETQVEMETNENVQSQWKYYETRLHKRRRCYKKTIK